MINEISYREMKCLENDKTDKREDMIKKVN